MRDPKDATQQYLDRISKIQALSGGEKMALMTFVEEQPLSNKEREIYQKGRVVDLIKLLERYYDLFLKDENSI